MWPIHNLLEYLKQMKNLIIFMTFMLFLSAFARNDLVPVFRLEIEYDDHHFSEIIYFYNPEFDSSTCVIPLKSTT